MDTAIWWELYVSNTNVVSPEEAISAGERVARAIATRFRSYTVSTEERREAARVAIYVALEKIRTGRVLPRDVFVYVYGAARRAVLTELQNRLTVGSCAAAGRRIELGPVDTAGPYRKRGSLSELLEAAALTPTEQRYCALLLEGYLAYEVQDRLKLSDYRFRKLVESVRWKIAREVPR